MMAWFRTTAVWLGLASYSFAMGLGAEGAVACRHEGGDVVVESAGSRCCLPSVSQTPRMTLGQSAGEPSSTHLDSSLPMDRCQDVAIASDPVYGRSWRAQTGKPPFTGVPAFADLESNASPVVKTSLARFAGCLPLDAGALASLRTVVLLL